MRIHSVVGIALLTLPWCGCTSFHEYVSNGFKVGPNYHPPEAAVAPTWLDASDKRVRTESDDLSRWWSVFNDPVLDALIADAYKQNLTLRQAAFRVLEARAQLGIAVGNVFPQSQFVQASFTQNALSGQIANSVFETPIGPLALQRFYPQWNFPMAGAAWELDFWGRLRRAVEAESANLDASVADYDDVLVTMLSDIANNYVQMRTIEQQIEYARTNVQLQRETLVIVEARFKASTVSGVDLRQAKSTLAQTGALIPELEIGLRQKQNQLCVLLGIPPEDLQARVGTAAIPSAQPEVAVGIPAELLSRRPDVRRAERKAASQSARIGIAEASLYPVVSINGTIGYAAQQFKDLWGPAALMGSVGPSIQWNILQYGRIINDIRLQDAKFQEAIANYQDTVLRANQEVENGLVVFLKAQQRAKLQAESVEEDVEAYKLVLTQYKGGTVDFTRVTQLQLALVQQQDTLAQARGEIAQGLIQVYKALGGGWQIRESACAPSSTPAPSAPARFLAPHPMQTQQSTQDVRSALYGVTSR